MRIRNVGVLGALAVLASGLSAWAQPIAVSINGGTPTLYSDSSPISINIGTVNNTVTVHIYDTDSLFANGDVPTHSIPAVTINGTVGTGSPLVEVLIADGDSYFFPPFPTFEIAEGCINVAGLSFGSTALRDISRVAIAAYGNITGNVSAGAVRRVQAYGRFTPSYTGGKITGNITATTDDYSTICGNFGFQQFRAMGVIWAGDEISGTISCTSDDDDNPGSLTWLLIGREDNPGIDGLLGDVRIDHGQIEKIHTAGPIGSATVASKIWAGRGIWEIRAIDDAEVGAEYPTATAALDFNADIATGLDPGDPDYTPTSYSTLRLLKTDGDLDGTVEVANLAAGVTTAPTGACGIIVGGAITAPITVKYNVEFADIIATSIDAPITIGVRLKGGVIATASNGQIHSVEIGYANEGLDPEDPGYDPVVEDYTAAWPRGFTGSECTPVDPFFAPPYDEYTHADWTAVFNHCVGYPYDGGSVDSVIRAASIGTVRIVELNALFTFLVSGNPLKPYHPRIESPLIDELRIERIREGTVWSGAMSAVEGQSGWEPVWDPAEAYSSIGTVVVDCIGPAGDLWVDGTTRVQVAGDVLGQIHVPTLTDRIWIGGRLGLWADFADTCANSYPGIYNYSLGTASQEDSPRDTTWTDEDSFDPLRRRGEIVVYEEDGLTLQGQIIINGTDNAGTWDGAVIVGDELGGSRIVISPDETQPDEAPYYQRVSSDLGGGTGGATGGAVGLAPFHFYPEDCRPEHHGYRLINQFHENNPIYLTFYGPVEAVDDAIATIEYHVPYRCYDDAPGNWNDNAIAMFLIEVDDVNPRRLKITPKDGMKTPGEYRVRTTSNLLCADVDGSPLPEPAEYYFWLALDCDGDGNADEDDFINIVYPDPCTAPVTPDLDIDCNRNGIRDCCDILVGGAMGHCDDEEDCETCEFTGKDCSPGCACDFNEDDVLNSQDFFDFLSCFFTPNCPDADYNGDNVVNSQDFFDFLGCFFNGCG